MKILFISPQPFFCDRGTPIRILHQVQALSSMGHAVDILCYPFGEPVDLPGMRILRSARPPGISDVAIGPSAAKFPLDLLLFWKAFCLCLRNRYDVIQAVEEAAFFAAALKTVFRTRFVYNMDSFLSDQLEYSGFLKSRFLLGIIRAIESRAMRKADFVVTVGPVLSDVVRKKAPGTAVLQLEDAPLEDTFVPDTKGAERLRAEFGLGAAPVAVYTGNFKGYQGVDLLVRSAAVVARQRPDIRIVLAGGDPADVAAMKKQAAESGADSICVFAGRRPAREMNAFMSLASALLTPRVLGTNPPLKIYPYMQTGRVIVATRVSTHTQVLDDSCAILAAPVPEEYGGAIVKAFNNPGESAAIAAAALKLLAEKYSLEIFHGKIRSAYGQMEQNTR